jgi:flagellar biosynthesis/type III secretory pathway protein FliH
MKKVLIGLFIIAVLICALNDKPKEKTTYTKDELEEAVWESYKRGFDEGYAEGEYYAEGDFERDIDEYTDHAYEAGYERGYEEGYDDCLVEHGLDTEGSHGSGWIKK